MNIRIRNEQPNDYRMVEEVTRRAFWNLYCPGCEEHYLIHSMRTHKDFIPELSFVIEVDEKIVGSIFYTYAKIVTPKGDEVKVISFGPVGIVPELHRKGLGRRLITHSIEEARRKGHRAIIIGGFPYHYHPYGFRGIKKYGITMPDGRYYTGIMALPLYDDALKGISGEIHFSEALAPDKRDLATFDADFPPMEKCILPCQKDFAKAFTEIDIATYNEAGC
ncbi:MAG: GNAT family N-acetyltransferase [Christensenellaceae bacterium]|jgi:predicted N-acetyltransferase YhbS